MTRMRNSRFLRLLKKFFCQFGCFKAPTNLKVLMEYYDFNSETIGGYFDTVRAVRQ